MLFSGSVKSSAKMFLGLIIAVFACDVHQSRTGAFSDGACPVFSYVLGRSTWNDSVMMQGMRNMLTSAQATFSFMYMDFIF